MRGGSLARANVSARKVLDQPYAGSTGEDVDRVRLEIAWGNTAPHAEEDPRAPMFGTECIPDFLPFRMKLLVLRSWGR